jgi:hypothetical protein
MSIKVDTEVSLPRLLRGSGQPEPLTFGCGHTAGDGRFCDELSGNNIHHSRANPTANLVVEAAA